MPKTLSLLKRQELDEAVMCTAQAMMRRRGGITIRREDIRHSQQIHGHTIDIANPKARLDKD